MTETRVPINFENDIIAARQAGRDLALKLGFGAADQTRLATAISELTRNVIQYAKKGVCVIRDESDAQMIRVRVVVEDSGPGIGDVGKAMQEGFSTGRSMGMGLPGTKRLVHDFDINSKPGATRVAIAIARPRTAGTPPPARPAMGTATPPQGVVRPPLPGAPRPTAGGTAPPRPWGTKS